MIRCIDAQQGRRSDLSNQHRVLAKWTHQRLSHAFDAFHANALEQRRVEDICTRLLARW